MTTTPQPAPVATARPRGGPRTGRGASGPGRFGGGSPLVYAVALVVVAVTLGPVVYAVLGGFRTNDQLAASPAGLPDPWVLTNYQSVLLQVTE